MKRSPINLRRLALIPKTQNPKAIALFLSAFLNLSKAGVLDQEGLIELMIERLVKLRSLGNRYSCWGYSFPWQTRTIVVPRGTPNLVCTSFVANALLDAYEQRQDPRCPEHGGECGRVHPKRAILDRRQRGSSASLTRSLQPEAKSTMRIFLRPLCCVACIDIRAKRNFLALPSKPPGAQQGSRWQDGSWNYGEAASQQWIDNFHTGYNLCALQSIDRYSETSEFESNIQRGLKFYRTHFFREDGAPRYYHNRTYPIDIHCVAQSIITLLAFQRL